MLTSNDVAAARFPVVKWRVGYEIDEVNALLAEVRDTLAAYEGRSSVSSPVTSAAVARNTLNLTKFRDGWGQIEVDAYLRDIASTLREFETR